MCGIIGSVGKPNDLNLSFRILTNLLRETQKRGRHATGHFSVDLKNNIQTYKIDKEAEAYVNLEEWQEISAGNKALIGHTRMTTSGPQSINENNHPHISKCGNMGLVHNGVIFNYAQYKNEYENELISECDSELIIRMINSENNVEDGIKKVFKELGTGGDFACELIHRDPETGEVNFYFFRDTGRPGLMVDAREICGQIFFTSEEDIWKSAMNKANAPSSIRSLKPVSITPYQILKINSESIKVEKIDVERPVKKSRYTSTYTNTHWDGYEDSYYNRNNYHNYPAQSKRNPGNRNTINDLANNSKNDESVLDEDWTETVNEHGYPRFEYFPNSSKKKTKVKYDDIKEMFKFLIEDESQRYPGWEEEAFEAGALTYEQYEDIKQLQEEKENELDWELIED